VLRITSPANPRLREALRLVESARERRKSGRCVLEGAHLLAVYRERHGAPELVIVTEDALSRDEVRLLVDALPPANVVAVPTRLIAEHTAVPPEVGVLAVVPAPRGTPRLDSRLTLLVEDVQDPGNVGSMLRTAAAAGCEQVLLSRDCAFAWSPKVLRAGQGAHFLTHIAEDVDLVEWLARFRGAASASAPARAGSGMAVATVARDGEDVFTAPLRAPLAVAVGNEGAGLSVALAEACDVRVTIPMAGGSESLNAAAAAAVVLFEAVRQLRG